MKRDNFGSRIGILAAAAGSAVGLGNIWKFPYITGENGGAAFILVYLFCIALIGLPVMITEFALGRNTQSNAVGAFKKIAPKKPWFITGFLSVLTAFIILSFYAMIAGWVFSYLARSITGGLGSVPPDKLADYFGTVVGGSKEAIFWNFFVLVLTGFVVILGVKDGIEKCCKMLMPLLVVIIILLIFRSVTLEGASKGLEFLFKPDFSNLTTKGVLEALGHAFYSLSLAMGITMTYGSYISKKENIGSLAVQVTIADTVIALMAGMVIFPAVFAYNFEPGQGPALIFITLPAVFDAMPFGNVFQILFFLLIGIAAVTSCIALLEVSVAFVSEEFKINRKTATVILTVILFLLSIPSTLSFGAWSDVTIFGKTFFDLFDFLTAKIFLPLGGLFICIFAGWVWGAKNVVNELTNEGSLSFKFERVYGFIIKFIAPIAIIVIFLNQLLN